MNSFWHITLPMRSFLVRLTLTIVSKNHFECHPPGWSSFSTPASTFHRIYWSWHWIFDCGTFIELIFSVMDQHCSYLGPTLVLAFHFLSLSFQAGRGAPWSSEPPSPVCSLAYGRAFAPLHSTSHSCTDFPGFWRCPWLWSPSTRRRPSEPAEWAAWSPHPRL